jgi:phage gp29-like protein
MAFTLPPVKRLLERFFGKEQAPWPGASAGYHDGRLGLAYSQLAPTIYEVREALMGISQQPAKFYQVCERVRTVYPHALTEFLVRRASLRGVRFEITLMPEARPTPATEKAMERLGYLFRPEARRGLIMQSQMALQHGMAPAEILFSEMPGGMGIHGVQALPEEWFFWRDGELRLSHSALRQQASEITPEQAFKLVVPTYSVVPPASDNARYGGLMRYVLMATALAWTTLYESIRSNERAGKPPRIGRYPQHLDADSKEVQELRNAVSHLGHDLGAVLPDDMVLEIMERSPVTPTAQAADKILDRLDQVVAKLYNGTSMLTNESTHGTKAQATAQTRVADDLFDEDMERAEGVLTDVLTRLWQVNISATEACPLMVRGTWRDAVDTERLASTVETLARTGMRIPTAWVHKTFEIPEPVGDEPTLMV